MRTLLCNPPVKKPGQGSGQISRRRPSPRSKHFGSKPARPLIVLSIATSASARPMSIARSVLLASRSAGTRSNWPRRFRRPSASTLPMCFLRPSRAAWLPWPPPAKTATRPLSISVGSPITEADLAGYIVYRREPEAGGEAAAWQRISPRATGRRTRLPRCQRASRPHLYVCCERHRAKRPRKRALGRSGRHGVRARRQSPGSRRSFTMKYCRFCSTVKPITASVEDRNGELWIVDVDAGARRRSRLPPGARPLNFCGPRLRAHAAQRTPNCSRPSRHRRSSASAATIATTPASWATKCHPSR